MAAVFTWTSYVDTDLAFSEFFNSNHTMTLRRCPPLPGINTLPTARGKDGGASDDERDHD